MRVTGLTETRRAELRTTIDRVERHGGNGVSVYPDELRYLLDRTDEPRSLQKYIEDRAEWLYDAIGTCSQHPAFRPLEEDEVLRECIYLNGKKVIKEAVQRGSSEYVDEVVVLLRELYDDPGIHQMTESQRDRIYALLRRVGGGT